MLAMFNFSLALLTAVVVSALPHGKQLGGVDVETTDLPLFFQPAITEIAKRVPGGDGFVQGKCDLQNAVQYMNLAAATSPAVLPPPESSLRLFHVAIGRGTQNYTCDLSNSTAVPVAIGAHATLFNASCIAAEVPALLSILPGIALDLPLPSVHNFEAPLMRDVSGEHYFIDNFTTPYFNLDTKQHKWGRDPMNKTAATNAPAGAPVGQNGAVPWLQLDAMANAHSKFKQVYRLNTAGGNPPTTCKGQKHVIEVPYAAEYWIFTS